jgi:hypothetical protein
VPTADIGKLKQDKRIAMYRTVVDRLIYLHLDSNRDASPFVTDKDGKELPAIRSRTRACAMRCPSSSTATPSSRA